MRTPTHGRTPMLVRFLVVAVVALSCAGCFTPRVFRVATGSDHFGAVKSAWTRPSGGLCLELEAALGTYATSSMVVDVTAEDLEAAHRTEGPYALDRSMIRNLDAESLSEREPIVIGRLFDKFGWSPREVAELRAPDDLSGAVICGGEGSALRVAHLRRGAGPSGGGYSGWSVAVLEVRPGEAGGAAYAWPLVPVALAADVALGAACAAVLVVGVVGPAFGGGEGLLVQ